MKYVSINPMHDMMKTAAECTETYGAQTIGEIIAQLRDIIDNNDDITEDTPIFWGDYYATCCCDHFCDIVVDWDETEEDEEE